MSTFINFVNEGAAWTDNDNPVLSESIPPIAPERAKAFGLDPETAAEEIAPRGWQELADGEETHRIVADIHDILDMQVSANDWKGTFRVDYYRGRAYYTLQISSRDMSLLTPEEIEAASMEMQKKVLIAELEQMKQAILNDPTNLFHTPENGVWEDEEGTHTEGGIGFYL